MPFQPGDVEPTGLRETISDHCSTSSLSLTSCHLRQLTFPGLPTNPLYKIHEICKVLRASEPTIYEWIDQGEISPYRINTRTFFTSEEVKRKLQPKPNGIGYKN